MKRFALLMACFGAVSLQQSAMGAAATISPYLSFGGGDGWLAPGEGGTLYLGTGSNERGMSVGNGHVYLVSHASVAGTTANVRILDGTTGADLGALNNTGIAGGTFLVNNSAVGADGAIYVANLTIQSTTSPFKVYKWATEGAAPTLAYSGDGGLPGSRLGDDLAGFGSGSSTVLAAGYNSSPVVAGNNGYAIIDPTTGTATRPAFTGTPPNAGDMRLGLTFVDANHVLGTAGSSLYRNTSYSGSTATLINSPAIPDPSGAAGDRLLSYNVINGLAILAVQNITDSHVSLYDVSNPSAPVYMASGNNTSGTLTANSNAVGELGWGSTVDNGDGTFSARLYAMSCNQGIQAFTVTVGAVPEPSTLALGLLGMGVLFRRNRRK